LEQSTKADLLTTPFCLTNDGQQASFAVNQIQPFQVTNALVGAGAFQGFDQATASSQLQITPRISSGNNLTLDIALDISSFTSTPQNGAPPPSNERQYTGTVTVPNREYIVFGGLEQETYTETHNTIPIIGDIPFIGWLFGSTVRNKERRRIYVFVRPVIFTDEDFDDEKKGSVYARDRIRGQSQIGNDAARPIIPEDVLNAQAPGTRSDLYGLLGDGGSLGVPEEPSTVMLRRNIGKRGGAADMESDGSSAHMHRVD
ncbi:MAG: type II and III secretion system protein, partial [Polyangiaceae bacterium]